MVKNILITGSGGFVGKNLKEFLSSKYNLLCPRSAELDLADEFSVKKYFENNEIDFVIHCANKGGARGLEDGQSVIDDNLKMFHNLEYNLNGKRMIFFGSGAQFDRTRPLDKVKEEEIGAQIPKEPYGYAKLFIAKEIEKLDNVLCLNIFGSYGKYEKENRFPSYAIAQNLNREPIVINKNVIFDYLHIDDLCKIVEHFIKHGSSEKIINITPSESISLLEIAQIVNQISGFESEIIVKDQALEHKYTGDNGKLLKEIPHFEFTSYKKGLEKLFNHLSFSHRSFDSKFKNYIFDLDGTLVNSSEEVMICFKRACDNLGAEINFSKYTTDVIGPPLEKIFETIIVDNKNEKLIKALVVEFNRIYDFDENDPSPMYEGIQDWLTALKNSDKRLFMATNKFSNPTVRLIEKFNMEMFEDVYTIDTYKDRYISKQQMIEEIIEKHGLNRNETIMVGDTTGDINAAHGAGIKGIGVLWGYGRDKNPLKEVSDYVIDLSDLNTAEQIN